MKRLHQKVNIVPVIAKADTLTAPEVWKLKQRILADIEEHQIQVYISRFFFTLGLIVFLCEYVVGKDNSLIYSF